VTATEHGLANGHEVRNGMVAIADELDDLAVAHLLATGKRYLLEIIRNESLQRSAWASFRW